MLNQPFLRVMMVAAVLAISGGVAVAAGGGNKPLNILILYPDDWRWDTLSIEGNPVVKTPRIDALAREGVRFTNSRVTTSVCWVGRACLFTGQWMSRHGASEGRQPIAGWAETYPMLLRQAGYHTGHVGKWHNGKFPAGDFDFGRSYGGRHYVKAPDGEMVHVTVQNERDAMAFLDDRPAGKPFVLTVAFFATHAEDPNPKQFIYQPESAPLYKDDVVPVPKTATQAHVDRLPPFLSDEQNEGRVRWRWRFDTPERYQEYMKAYYRMATEVDTVCGRLIDRLRKEGELDRTLIVFTTDNGYFHGEHGLADKWYPYEESIRVPLIVRDPRLPPAKRGSTYDEFVLNIDIAPMVLAAAGISPPARMQGQNLADIYLRDQRSRWADGFFYEHPTVTRRERIPYSEALVEPQWKYIYWREWDYEQLFHTRADPFEERDLARQPEYAAKLAEMRQRFKTWQERVK